MFGLVYGGDSDRSAGRTTVDSGGDTRTPIARNLAKWWAVPTLQNDTAQMGRRYMTRAPLTIAPGKLPRIKVAFRSVRF